MSRSVVVGSTTPTDRRGALEAECGSCGVPVEVAPENAALLDDGAELRCLRCVSEDVASSATLPRLALTAEAAARLRKRERRLARRLGLPAGSVRSWPPPELLAAAELRGRRN